MKRYVVGFAFTANQEKVLLIEKRRPQWQYGFLNGIGGKIERGEEPQEAMEREALEEALLIVDWVRFGRMSGINNDGSEFEVHMFTATDDTVGAFSQMEDEPLALFDTFVIRQLKTIANVQFLIPMAMGADGLTFAELIYK